MIVLLYLESNNANYRDPEKFPVLKKRKRFMVSERKEQNRYGAIDGLRTIACFGIVMMHMAANNSYEISGWFYASK